MLTRLRNLLSALSVPQGDPPRDSSQGTLLAGPSKRGYTFETAICRQFGADSLEGITDQLHQMYARYAISSADRGRNAATSIERFVSLRGKDVLDVGCAFCGFLIACAERGAGTLTGVDVDPYLIKLGDLQLDDYGCRADVRTGDILDERLISQLGTFDIIFCNDVIEHVDNPQKCITHMAAMLREGGILFIEVPNAYSFDNMICDCHFNLFCITPLLRTHARTYHQLHFSRPYDVSFLAPLTYYVHTMGCCGLMVRVLTTEACDEEITDAVFNQLETRSQEFKNRLHELSVDQCRGNKALLECIMKTGTRILQEYSDRAALVRSSQDALERQIMMRDLLLTYGDACWTIIGKKEPL